MLSYALEQNKGNVERLAEALCNIAYHAFNQNDNYGDWCNYHVDKQNYGGFQSPQLFKKLIEINTAFISQ